MGTRSPSDRLAARSCTPRGGGQTWGSVPRPGWKWGSPSPALSGRRRLDWTLPLM